MKSLAKLEKFLPLLFIVFIWLIFSFPFLFQSKIPFASDYLVNFFAPWNSYPATLGPVKNNAMPDVISQIVPWKHFTIESFMHGQIPLWNPYSFSGTAHAANYQSAIFSPFNLLFFVFSFVDAWSLLVLLQPVLAGIFMYSYLRSISLDKIPSLVGSVSFMFCGFITCWLGYATLGYAILFLPFALFCIEKYFALGKKIFLLLFSLSFPLSFFSGHFQISIYFSIFVFSYLLLKFNESKEYKKSLQLFLWALFGLLLTMPQVLPSVEAYTQSLRSGIFQKIEAIPWGYFSTFFAPDFLGNPVTRNDWFGHYAEWNGFAGTITLLISFLAFLKINKKVIFFAIFAIVSILFSFQSPFVDFLVFLKIPVISTSALSRIIVLFSFSIAVLSGFGLENLMKKIKERKIYCWIFGVLLFLFLLWTIVIFKIFIPIDKIAVARQNLILPSILTLILLFLIFSSKVLQNKFKTKSLLTVLSIIILLLSSFDLLRFATKWQPFEPRSQFFPQVPIANKLDKTLISSDRLFSNLGGEFNIYYGFPGIEGYDAVYNRRYGEFISSVSNGDIQEASRSVVQFPKYGLYSQEVLNLLGVKYIIQKNADGRAVWTYPVWNFPKDYDLIYSDSAFTIFQNKSVFPRVFLSSNFVVRKNPQEIINAMFVEDKNLRNTLVLEEQPVISPKFKNGSAQISYYSPDKILINTKADGPSLLFLSDTFYPGWSAYVDGKNTKIYRADYTFRAIVLSKGDHKVEFIFSPISFKIGVLLAMLAVFLICLSFVEDRLHFLPKFKV